MKEKLFEELWLCVTLKCNANCKYCWWNKFGKHKDLSMDENTADKALDFINKNVSEGGVITFFGGEPLMEFGIIKYIMNKKKHWNYHLFTNASLLRAEIINFFWERRDFIRMTLSIDGMHDTQFKNRGVKINYNLISEVIRKFGRTKIKTTIPDPQNLYQDVKFLCNLGVKRLELNIPEFMELSNEYYTLLEKQLDMIKNDKEICDIVDKPMDSRKLPGFCRCGEDKFSILPNGDIYPCDVFACFGRDKIGDVFSGINLKERDRFLNYKKSKCKNTLSSCYVYDLYLRGEIGNEINGTYR